MFINNKIMKKQTRTNQLISIVMPVYNAELYLVESLKSIINQTYSNWELIVVDDCSTDKSFQILNKFAQKDNRIKVFKNKKRLGVAGTANFALKKANSKLIARMDADDIMHPQRLEKQRLFLLENKDVGLVGTQCVLINKSGKKIGYKYFPTSNQDIYRMIFHSIPIQQPTAMFNLNVLNKNILLYDQNKTTAEEVEVLFRILTSVKTANLPDVLLSYRLHGENTSLKNPKKTFYSTFLTRFKAITEYGYVPSFTGFVLNLMQLVFISVLPGKYITPVYYFLRVLIGNGNTPIKNLGFSSIMH